MKILVGFLAIWMSCGFISTLKAQSTHRAKASSVKDISNTEIASRLIAAVDFDRFRFHLEQICTDPHPAGTPANEAVMRYIAKVMEDAGLDTEIFPYDVYLSSEPGESFIEIVTPIRTPLNQMEYIVAEDPYSSHEGLEKGWNAWSGSGDVTAEVVYVNYGRKEDFEHLKKMGVSLEGKIAIARYGGNFRGYKAKFAEEYGAVGLIIYTDPMDSGYMKGLVYPEGMQFSESSIQRGSLLTLDYVGDPLTPFNPSLPIDGEVRIERISVNTVPFHSIPVTAIGYGSAKSIMELMEGRPVPNGWQGGLPFTYRVEGGESLQMRLKVEQEKKISRINNVVGTVKGTEHPDEWIILGSHYDAWTFGAADPNSGTALILCLAETLGAMAKKGMTPKRSIKLAHWDAEEHGLIGSTEWVEQWRKELSTNTVAYINLDAAVTGRNFNASASPLLKQLIIETSKEIPFPDSSKTLFEVWNGRSKDTAEPSIGSLGGGSDHVAFYMHAGVQSMNIGSGGGYLYHTNYDNLHFYEKFCDPTFKMGGMMTQMAGLLALRLANEDLHPYQVARYSKDFDAHLSQILKSVQSLGGDSSLLNQTLAASERLKATCQSFEEISKVGQKANHHNWSELNRQFRSLEQCWLNTGGNPFSDWYLSLYAASDPFSGYSSWLLPGFQYFIEMKDLSGLSEWDGHYSNALDCLVYKIKELEEFYK